MGSDVEVKAAEPVAAEGVSAALKDNCCGVVVRHAGPHDVFEELGVGEIIDAVIQGDVEGVVRARVGIGFGPRGIHTAGAGEVDCFFVFMEGEGHDSVGRPKGLFDPVAMVDIDVDVEDAGMVEEQL